MIKFSKQFLCSVAFVAGVGCTWSVAAADWGSAMTALSNIQSTASGVSSAGKAVANVGDSAESTGNAVSGIGSASGVVGTANAVGKAAGSAKSTLNSITDAKNKTSNVLGGNSGSSSGSGSGSNSGSGSSGSGSGSEEEHKLQITDVPKGQRPAGEDPKKNMTEEEKDRARDAQATLVSGSYASEAARTGIGVASGVLSARSLPVAQQRYATAQSNLANFKGDTNSSAYKNLVAARDSALSHYQQLAKEALSGAATSVQTAIDDRTKLATLVKQGANRVGNNTYDALLQKYGVDPKSSNTSASLVKAINTEGYAADATYSKAESFAKDAGLLGGGSAADKTSPNVSVTGRDAASIMEAARSTGNGIAPGYLPADKTTVMDRVEGAVNSSLNAATELGNKTANIVEERGLVGLGETINNKLTEWGQAAVAKGKELNAAAPGAIKKVLYGKQGTSDASLEGGASAAMDPLTGGDDGQSAKIAEAYGEKAAGQGASGSDSASSGAGESGSQWKLSSQIVDANGDALGELGSGTFTKTDAGITFTPTNGTESSPLPDANIPQEVRTAFDSLQAGDKIVVDSDGMIGFNAQGGEVSIENTSGVESWAPREISSGSSGSPSVATEPLRLGGENMTATADGSPVSLLGKTLTVNGDGTVTIEGGKNVPISSLTDEMQQVLDKVGEGGTLQVGKELDEAGTYEVTGKNKGGETVDLNPAETRDASAPVAPATDSLKLNPTDMKIDVDGTSVNLNGADITRGADGSVQVGDTVIPADKVPDSLKQALDKVGDGGTVSVDENGNISGKGSDGKAVDMGGTSGAAPAANPLKLNPTDMKIDVNGGSVNLAGANITKGPDGTVNVGDLNMSADKLPEPLKQALDKVGEGGTVSVDENGNISGVDKDGNAVDLSQAAEAPDGGDAEVQGPEGHNKAGEVDNDGKDESKGDGPRDGGYWDPIQSIMVAIMPGLKDNTVDEFKNVIIEAADIGDAMGAIDQTAMNEEGDGVNANTPSSGVAYSVALLQNVPIDVARWIDTKVGEDTDEAESVTVSSINITNSGVVPETTPSSTDEEEEDSEEKDPYKVEIVARRMELARQYANAGVQIAEGMSAISEDFPARAELLLEELNRVRSYAGAIGALSDIVREDLAETLRATALSSAELGVASSRVLLDSGFVKKKKEDNKDESDSGSSTPPSSDEGATPPDGGDSGDLGSSDGDNG